MGEKLEIISKVYLCIFDSDISKINVDSIAVKDVISQLSKEKEQLQKSILEKTKFNNIVVYDIHKTIEMYAKELNVQEYTKPNKDYIFTSDLKSLSGAVLHKIMFIFKLAYIIAIEKKLGIKLPIILDLPSGRELNKINIDEMINILNRDFKDNQIIIASINEYSFDEVNKIKLKDSLLDEYR